MASTMTRLGVANVHVRAGYVTTVNVTATP
jgi:hypothetical protein